jgi:hypothetical protein
MVDVRREGQEHPVWVIACPVPSHGAAERAERRAQWR